MSYHPRNHHTSWVRRDQAILAGDADKAAARIGFRVSGWGELDPDLRFRSPSSVKAVPASTNQYQPVPKSASDVGLCRIGLTGRTCG